MSRPDSAPRPRGVVAALRRVSKHPLAPLALLVLQLLLVYRDLDRRHGFRPAYMPDSESYLQLARAPTLEMALAHYRTNGYPLFLRLLGGGQVDTARVPLAQFTLYSLATLLFWLALRRYTGSAWLAFAGAMPLAYAWILDLVPQVMTDLLAVTLTLVAVSLVLLLATRPRAPLLWAALALAVFAAYQVRPAIVFLVAWVPLAAAGLRLCRERRPAPGLLRWTVALALVTVVPFLAFAGLRLAVVGHFGLVSFGGTNLAGVAACFLDDEVVASLPTEQRRPAAVMLRLRRRLGFQPMTAASDPMASFEQYSDNIWEVALRASRVEIQRRARLAEQRGEEPDRRRQRIQRNEIMGATARAILRARPGLYLRWVRSAVLEGLAGLPERPWIRWPFLLLCASTLVLALRRATGAGAGLDPPGNRRLLGVAVTGVSYFLIYLVLLCLVSWPFPRYAAAIILFLPSVLCMLLWEAWRRILRPLAKTAG